MQAAARQLETLANLEQREQPTTFLRVNESYLGNAPADAGAGVVTSRYSPPLLASSQLGSTSNEASLPTSNNNESVPPTNNQEGLSQSFYQPPTGSLHVGVSTELRRILSMSTIFDNESLVRGNEATSLDDDRRTERQYLWLERYHAHMSAQNQNNHRGGDLT
jgi:hypothetical protein